MLSDPSAIVRCAALETLCDVLCLVQDFPISDAVIFPEYILPMLSLLPDDTEESVRVCYASNIHKLALTAYRFLLRSRSIADIRPLDESVVAHRSQSADSPAKRQDNFFRQLAELRKSIYEIVQDCFLGQIVYVCYFIGARSVEEYLLPYLEQALSDDMEAVLVNALDCLTMMCRSGYLRKRVIVGLCSYTWSHLHWPLKLLFLSCLKPPLPKSIFYEGLEHAQDIGDILLKSSGKKEQIVHGGRYPAPFMMAYLRNTIIFFCTDNKRGLGETHMVPDSSVYKASIRLPWLEPNRPAMQTRDDHFSSTRQDFSINDSMKSNSSLQGDIIPNSDTGGLPFSRSAVNLETGWKPRGILVAHLQEHRSSVNDIAVSNDNTFFVTASDDSSIKIWDTRKLEKDIAFRSRLTYSMGLSKASVLLVPRRKKSVRQKGDILEKAVGNDESYDIRSSFGIQVVQEMYKQSSSVSGLTPKTQLAVAAADSAGCHRDANTRVGILQLV
ncbi:hypothetical protein Zm00014a_040768 [Zea mays]|uniref:non-specific serine/threonine protein kinase n=2 Tax=Zea mays TaxID=4577 RepID=A0A3L6D947_MAIZE|nr:hypothetical protein Zm00014a_040768 [Zea mays]PWZ04164.1 putative serine/threonine-protein kinase vps15 [Zea mays]PWZ04165.1 hypothetical protein Zm00014a_040768 [Zea mays]